MNIVFGIIFIFAGIFQTITVYLIYQGHDHYTLKVFNKRVAMIIYAIFALILYYLGIRSLF